MRTRWLIIPMVCVSWASGQSSTASLRGIITDPTKAGVPDSTVTVIDVLRNMRTSTSTDMEGRYVFPQLQPSTYNLYVEASGFEAAQVSNFILQVGQEATIDVTLRLGTPTTIVEVSGAAPLINFASAGMGQVVENSYIRSLPLVDRYFVRLVFLAPGVVGVNADPGLANTSHPARFASNGVRAGTADFFVDGALVSSLDQFEGGTFLELKPSMETIQEFKLQTNVFSAEFGRSGGTLVNLVSKSGTNEFHGSLFEYHRRDEFNAQSFFAKRAGWASLPDVSYHKMGGTVGGPVMLPGVYNGRNRTFFHFGLDYWRHKAATDILTTVPTTLQRRGDFSDTRDASGRLFTVYNPFDTYSAPNGRILRRPFPGNVVPLSMQSPIARKVLEYYPQPTSEGDPVTRANNYFRQGSQTSDQAQALVRIDHIAGDKQRLYVRHSRERSRPRYDPFRPFGDSPADPNNPTWLSRARTWSLQYDRTPDPTTVLTVRYGLTRQPVWNFFFSQGFDPTSLGLPSVLLVSGEKRFPRFAPEGYVPLGAPGGAGARRATTTNSVNYSLTKIAGGHSLKTGGESRIYQLNITTFNSPCGSFTFSRRPTSEDSLLASPIQGNGLASMLLGWGSGGNLGISGSPASTSKYHAWYMQDDWKITRDLTLNLGLRYEFEVPRTERFDRYTWFDPDAVSPIDGRVPGLRLRGALRFTGNGIRSPFDRDMNNVQPRIGFAYRLNDHTSVRAGYGIYYSLGNAGAANVFGPPFTASTSIEWSRDGGITPYATLANPFPDGVLMPGGKGAGAATRLGLALDTESRAYIQPQYQQWALSIQRRLPLSSVLEINYVGTKGTHLPFGGLGAINRLHPVYWALGRSELNRIIPNPFYGVIMEPVSILSQPTIQLHQLLRPYPHYTSVIVSEPYIANSIYHAGQIKLEKRFSHGFGLLAHYSWSKMIDDSANSGYSLWGGETPIQNLWDLRQERSLSPLDVAHRAVITFVYELPIGRGRAIGTSWNRILDLLAGGWSISGISTLQTGYAPSISLASPNLWEGSQRPNLIGNPSMPGSVRNRLDNYFNRAAFSYPSPDSYGSAARTLSYRTPGFRRVDLAVGRSFRVRERGAVEVRLEAFNALNGVAFGPPNTTFGSVLFGQIRDYASGFGPRELQIALRYDF